MTAEGIELKKLQRVIISNSNAHDLLRDLQFLKWLNKETPKHLQIKFTEGNKSAVFSYEDFKLQDRLIEILQYKTTNAEYLLKKLKLSSNIGGPSFSESIKLSKQDNKKLSSCETEKVCQSGEHEATSRQTHTILYDKKSPGKNY